MSETAVLDRSDPEAALIDDIKDKLGTKGPYKASERPGVSELVKTMEESTLGGLLSPEELKEARTDRVFDYTLGPIERSLTEIRIPEAGVVEVPGTTAQGGPKMLAAQRSLILGTYNAHGNLFEQWQAAEPQVGFHEAGGVASISYDVSGDHLNITEVNLFDSSGNLYAVRYILSDNDPLKRGYSQMVQHQLSGAEG